MLALAQAPDNIHTLAGRLSGACLALNANHWRHQMESEMTRLVQQDRRESEELYRKLREVVWDYDIEIQAKAIRMLAAKLWNQESSIDLTYRAIAYPTMLHPSTPC